MATNRSSFDIEIKTTADTTGAKEAAKDMKNLGESAEKSGHAAHEAGISHHELHQAVHLLKAGAGEALGPIGEFAHFLGNPYIMAVAGATLAVKMLTE